MGRFENKTVIVTGSTRGIGLAAAEAFLKEGANVVIFCRHKSHAQPLKKPLIEHKDRILFTYGDVRKEEDVDRIVGETVKRFDTVDILVNNAGMAVWKLIEETLPKEMHAVIDSNVKGSWLFARAVMPIMKKRKRGRIIHVSSGLGLSGREKYTAYCATKFGLIGLSEALDDEGKEFGIRSYPVCPGAVATKLHLDMHPWEDAETMMQPEDVAPYVLDAASDAYLGKKCVIADR